MRLNWAAGTWQLPSSNCSSRLTSYISSLAACRCAAHHLYVQVHMSHADNIYRLQVITGCRAIVSCDVLQAETEQKDNFAAALAANRKALDESRQERGSLRYEVDAKNRKAEALATELHLTETSLSERQAEVALLKGHERDYLLKIATLEVSVDLLVVILGCV